MSERGNDWGLTNPRAVRRGCITNFFRIEEEEGTRSTESDKKNTNCKSNRTKIIPHKKHTKKKKANQVTRLRVYIHLRYKEEKGFLVGRPIQP